MVHTGCWIWWRGCCRWFWSTIRYRWRCDESGLWFLFRGSKLGGNRCRRMFSCIPCIRRCEFALLSGSEWYACQSHPTTILFTDSPGPEFVVIFFSMPGTICFCGSPKHPKLAHSQLGDLNLNLWVKVKRMQRMYRNGREKRRENRTAMQLYVLRARVLPLLRICEIVTLLLLRSLFRSISCTIHSSPSMCLATMLVIIGEGIT